MSMKILLLDIDSKIPNLVLIKFSAWQRIKMIRFSKSHGEKLLAEKPGKGVIEARGRYRPRRLISTGLFVQDHLLEVVEDYPYS